MVVLACGIAIFLFLPGTYGSCMKADAPDSPSEGRIIFESNSDPAPDGSKASLQCKGGYRPRETTKRLQCNSGTWTGDLGACKAQTTKCDPELCLACNKRHLTDLVAPSGTFNFAPSNDTERAEHLTYAMYACASGFGIKSRELADKITCETGNCEEDHAAATLNDTFLCHFGIWVGKLKNNHCVPPDVEDDIATLSAECSTQSPRSLELGRSCYVLSVTQTTVPVARQSCHHLTNFPGHLPHIAEDGPTMTALRDFLTAKGVLNVFVDLERLNTSGANTEGWYFMSEKGNWTAEHHTIAWDSREPNSRDMYNCVSMICSDYGYGPLASILCDGFFQSEYYCQYESQYKVYVASTREGEKGGQVLAKHESITARVECAKLCSECPVCQSFSYNRVSKECTLHPFTSDHTKFEAQPSGDTDIFDNSLI